MRICLLVFLKCNKGNILFLLFLGEPLLLRDNDNSESLIFQKFRNYRNEIARRIASQNPNYSGIIDSTGFPEGYGAASQDVIIPPF